jgi:hypothetical protein
MLNDLLSRSQLKLYTSRARPSSRGALHADRGAEGGAAQHFAPSASLLQGTVVQTVMAALAL